VFLIAIACSASAASDVKLEPNATLRFEFPDLHDTLMTKASGEKQPARLTAQLPENYSPGGEFPLLIFLTGALKSDQFCARHHVPAREGD
jgi:hypothetical protein